MKLDRARHYVQQDDRISTIRYASSDWETLRDWYSQNGLDLGDIVRTGGTVVEDGKLYVTSLVPPPGDQQQDADIHSEKTVHEYRMPVTPLPEELFS